MPYQESNTYLDINDRSTGNRNFKYPSPPILLRQILSQNNPPGLSYSYSHAGDRIIQLVKPPAWSIFATITEYAHDPASCSSLNSDLWLGLVQRKCQKTAVYPWTSKPVRNVDVARVEGLCDLVDEMKREDTVHMQPAGFGYCCSGNVRLCFACCGSRAYLDDFTTCTSTCRKRCWWIGSYD